MTRFTLGTGLLVSITSLAVACSEDTTSGNNPNPEGGSDTGGASSGNGGASTSGGQTGSTGGTSAGNGGSAGTTAGSGGSAGTATSSGGSGTTDSGAGGAAAGGAAGNPGGGAAGALPDAGADLCAQYCNLEQQKCTFGTGGNAQFTSRDACMNACASYDKTGTPGTSSGNTLQCRMTHLGFITSDTLAAQHCPHTGETPTKFCL